jgi:hypothetical protein
MREFGALESKTASEKQDVLPKPLHRMLVEEL